MGCANSSSDSPIDSSRSICVGDTAVAPVKKTTLHYLEHAHQVAAMRTRLFPAPDLGDDGARFHRHYLLYGGALGVGSFATVYAGRHIETGRDVAIKIVKIGDDVESHARFMREVAIHGDCGHNPYIIRLLEVYPEVGVIVLQKATCNLLTFLAGKYESGLPICIARRALVQVAAAVDSLHGRAIVHGDLKLENVLLVGEHDASDPGRLFFSLGDFGSAFRVGTRRLKYGTRSWSPPETYRLIDGHAKETLGTAADVWAFGILAYCLLTGVHPFFGLHRDDLRSAILAGAWNVAPRRVPDGALSFLEMFFTLDPAHRVDIRRALAHPWLHGRDAPTAPLAAIPERTWSSSAE